MAQTSEEIAKDLVIAWLSHNSLSTGSAEKTGEYIGTLYKGVLRAVEEAETPAASVDLKIGTQSEGGRGPLQSSSELP